MKTAVVLAGILALAFFPITLSAEADLPFAPETETSPQLNLTTTAPQPVDALETSQEPLPASLVCGVLYNVGWMECTYETCFEQLQCGQPVSYDIRTGNCHCGTVYQ